MTSDDPAFSGGRGPDRRPKARRFPTHHPHTLKGPSRPIQQGPVPGAWVPGAPAPVMAQASVPQAASPVAPPADVIPWIFGIHTVTEALRRGLAFKRVLIQKSKGEKNPRIEALITICKESGNQFRFEEEAWFEAELHGRNHQGVAAELKGGTRFIADLAPFLAECKARTAEPLVMVLDRVTDQQNLGAIARSAHFFGVDLIIQEEHFSAPVDQVVHRVSSGASLLIPFHRAEKLSDAMNALAAAGFRVLGTDQEEATPLVDQADLAGPVAFLLGSEGSGVRPHLKRACQGVVRIAGHAGFDSLNVGSAAAVLCHEKRRQRGH